MRIIGNDPSVPRQTQEVASGTLPNGKPVVVNADGTVSVVAETGATQAVGSPTVFETASSTDVTATFDSSANKVVIAYTDNGNSFQGTAIVGTVSGTSISFGSPVVFEAASTKYCSATFDSSANKVVIAYRDDGNSDRGTAIVGTVSGTSISFGSAVVFETSPLYENAVSATFDSNSNKIVIAYRDTGNSNYGTAIVGTVSGTSISFGSAVVFEAADTRFISTTFDSDSNKVVIAYQDAGNNTYGTAIVGTVSGTSISFGSAVLFASAWSSIISITYDVNSNKVVIAYQDEQNSRYGTAIVGTVSGTSISFGTEVVFESATTAQIGSIYDATAQKVVIAYSDGGNSDAGTLVVGTVSGTSISFNTATVFESGESNFNGMAYESNAEKVVIAYEDGDNSSYGTSVVFQTAYTSPNITAENYIGMSRGVVDSTTYSASLGTAVEFETVNSQHPQPVYDPDQKKIIISYTGENNNPDVVVGTIDPSDYSVTFGTPVNIYVHGASTFASLTYDTTNNKIVICYTDESDGDKGKAVVGTVSGNSISLGTPVVFSDGSGNGIYPGAICFDSTAEKVVISYRDANDSSYGKAIVGTVSGTSISFGSSTTYESSNARDSSIVFDSSNNKVVICYEDYGNSRYGTAVVGTVSGTGISFGTPVVFESATTTGSVISFDSINNKTAIFYRDVGNSGYLTGIVGTVSGTSISFGSPTAVSVNVADGMGAAFNTTSGKFAVQNKNNADAYITYRLATISGTGISFDTVVNLDSSGDTGSLGNPGNSAVYVSDNNAFVFSYTASGADGTVRVLGEGYTDTTRGEVTNGNHALVDTQGAISDNQVGLTPGQSYFVQNDGTLGTTAADPSVFAGTAVSATKLIVKG